MRRRTDKLAAACAVICILCVVVLAFVIAPATLDTSDRTTDAASAASSAKRAAVSAQAATNSNRALIDVVNHESQTRERQFCKLVLGVHRDRVNRLKGTRAYFRTPESHDPTLQGLNAYIKRISLPQLVQEVRRERARLPKVCRKGS